MSYARDSPYTPFYSYAYTYRYWDPYWGFYWEPYWPYPYGFGGSFLRTRLRGSHPLSAKGHSHAHASGSKGGRGKERGRLSGHRGGGRLSPRFFWGSF